MTYTESKKCFAGPIYMKQNYPNLQQCGRDMSIVHDTKWANFQQKISTDTRCLKKLQLLWLKPTKNINAWSLYCQNALLMQK